MARNAGPTAEILLKRVREQGGVGTSIDFAIQLLSRCQRVVNAGIGRVITSSSFTINPEQLIYKYRDSLVDAVDVVSIKDGDRTLLRSSLADLSAYDVDWVRKVDGDRAEFWAQLGRDILVVYPGQAAEDSLTVYYTKLTTEVTTSGADYNTELDLAEEDVELAVGLGEVMMLARGRLLDEGGKRLERLVEEFGVHFGGVR